MYDHVKKELPEFASVIASRAESDSAFRDLLAEFEDICTWLSAQNKTGSTDPEELEAARDLKHALECEIKNVLATS